MDPLRRWIRYELCRCNCRTSQYSDGVGSPRRESRQSNYVKVGIRKIAVPGSLKVERSSKKLESVIMSDPEILGGTPCFRGTRVPVDSLIDYLEAGDSLGGFLDNFPSVSREEAAIVALEEAKAVPTSQR